MQAQHTPLGSFVLGDSNVGFHLLLAHAQLNFPLPMLSSAVAKTFKIRLHRSANLMLKGFQLFQGAVILSHICYVIVINVLLPYYELLTSYFGDIRTPKFRPVFITKIALIF